MVLYAFAQLRMSRALCVRAKVPSERTTGRFPPGLWDTHLAGSKQSRVLIKEDRHVVLHAILHHCARSELLSRERY